MGKLILLTLGIAIGVTAALLVSAYELRDTPRTPADAASTEPTPAAPAPAGPAATGPTA